MTISLKVKKNKQTVARITTSKKKRFHYFLQREEFQNCTDFELRIIYGKVVDHQGHLAIGVNEGSYSNKKDLLQAYGCFTEK